jgi:hypothetical protein
VTVGLPTAEPPYRMRTWTAVNGTPHVTAPVNGGDIDLISLGPASGSSASIEQGGTDAAHVAVPGTLVQVMAGAAFGAGVSLQTDAQGRAVPVSGGLAVLRSMAAASAAGEVVWAVVKSGR